jgi:hypothetical protein
MHYADLFTHRIMVRDTAHTEAFRRGIEATVTPGNVVLDWAREGGS